jgi:hypothetical protein
MKLFGKNKDKGKKQDEPLVDEKPPVVPLMEEKKGEENKVWINEPVNENELAIQQQELNKVRKPKVSYGAILKARQGERKAKAIARRDKGNQESESA